MIDHKQQLLHEFDAHVRRGIAPEPGIRIEHTSRIVRVVGQWNCVLYSDLDETTASAEIAAQQSYFASRGAPFEWKVYAHDGPADLEQRLEDAGFTPAEQESLMVLDLAEAATEGRMPAGIELRRIADAAGLEQVTRVGQLAFGQDFSAMNAAFAARLPLGTLAFYVAFHDAEPVAAGRLEMPSHGHFAGLFGGGTAPDYRRRGLYRCLVHARAAEARLRGYRYLTVEALPTSRRILAGLGFTELSTVRGWVATPAAAA